VEFLAILIALGCVQLWGSGGPVQRDDWFMRGRGRLTSMLSGPVGRAIALFIPALLIMMLQGSLSGAGYGLIELALLILVLLYSFGRGDLTRIIAEYLARWRRGDFAGAYEILKQEPVVSPDEGMIADPPQLHAWFRRRVYYRSFERLFAVLFWFVVAGAAGALLYRLAMIDEALEAGTESMAGDISEQETFPILYWLEWIPARLLSLSFAITGHYDSCVQAWKRGVSSSGTESAPLLEGCGNAALQIGGMMHTEEKTEAIIRRGADEIQLVEELQRRTLVVWMVVIAVIEMVF